MAWSKHVNSYPTEWIGIVQGIFELEKPIELNYIDPKKASSERLRWYAFFSAVRAQKHFLIPLIDQLQISCAKDSTTVKLFIRGVHKSPSSIYEKTLIAINEAIEEKNKKQEKEEVLSPDTLKTNIN